MILLELVAEFGLDPKRTAGTSGGEFHCACPKCGGTDRFAIWPNKPVKSCVGTYWCRQCGIRGDSIQFCREFLELSFTEAVAKVGASVAEVTSRIPNRNSPTRNSFLPGIKQLLVPEPVSIKWKNAAEEFVLASQEGILKFPSILQRLRSRGIHFEAVNKYRIGFNSSDINQDKCKWGLENDECLSKKDTIWLPKGIVIPTINVGKIIRLNIRRTDWCAEDKFPKYSKIPGSMKGMSIIGQKNSPVTIVVESELDAYALHYSLGDFALIIAVGGSTADPDIVTDDRAKQSKHLLICHDNDAAGLKMFEKWKRLYPNAIASPTPIGKDIGEFIEAGNDLRQWVLEKLPIGLTYKITSGD